MFHFLNGWRISRHKTLLPRRDFVCLRFIYAVVKRRRRILDWLAAVLCNPYWILKVILGMDKIIFKEKDLDVWNGTTFIQRKVV